MSRAIKWLKIEIKVFCCYDPNVSLCLEANLPQSWDQEAKLSEYRGMISPQRENPRGDHQCSLKEFQGTTSSLSLSIT